MQCVASTLHTTSEHGVSSITTADAHTSAAQQSTELKPHPPGGRFKWTGPFRAKDEIWFLRMCHSRFKLGPLLNKYNNIDITRNQSI